MPKASRDSLGARGKTDIYFFDPEQLVLVRDPGSLLYDGRVEDPVSEDLVSNLMFAPDGKVSLGIVEPVIGRRNTESGRVEVVAGRDRVKAAREANRRLKKQGRPVIRVPVWIRRVDDSHHLAALVSENEHRRSDSPLNRARKVQRFMSLGHDEREAAALFGVSESTVRNMLLLLDAPAAVRHALDAGKIAASAAYRLAREEPDKARVKLGALLEQAPRTPGRKQGSEQAARAREILRGPQAPPKRAPKAPEPAGRPPARGVPSATALEDRVAEAIAAWIERSWSGADWNGAPATIPARIRAGEWRQATTAEKGDSDGERPKRTTQRAVGGVDA